MAEIKSIEALNARKQAALDGMDPMRSGNARVLVGMATCGVAAGAQEVYDALTQELEAQRLDHIRLEPTGCVGICQFEPVVEIYMPDGSRTTYVRMTPAKAVQVVQQHLRGGNPIAEYTIGANK